MSQIKNFNAGKLWDENFSAPHIFQRLPDKFGGLGQSNAEPGHIFVSNSQGAGFFLFEKQGNNTATGAEDIAVAGDGKEGFLLSGVDVALDK